MNETTPFTYFMRGVLVGSILFFCLAYYLLTENIKDQHIQAVVHHAGFWSVSKDGSVTFKWREDLIDNPSVSDHTYEK